MKLANLNFTLPEGTTTHGDPRLLCFPATWNSIAVFIIGNYVAHAATVKTPPASTLYATIWIMLGALLVPSTGLVFGMSAFYQARKGRKQSALRKATLARALCMYVRADDWYKQAASSSRLLKLHAAVDNSAFNGKRVINPSWRIFHSISRQGRSVLWSLPALCGLYFGLSFDLTARHVFCMMKAADDSRGQQSEGMHPVSEDVSLSDSTIAGRNSIQYPIETAVIYTTRVSNLVNPDSQIYGLEKHDAVPGYVLAYVPIDSIVDPLPEPCHGLKTLEMLTKKRNTTKSLVALLQLCFSVFVLVRARGDQVALYGMAAFSLSVAPYAVMAVVDLLANLFVPHYDCLFLVENDVLREITSQYGHRYDDTVGKVRQIETGEPVTLHLPGQQDGGRKWVSGVPGFLQDARLRLISPDEAISDGVLPDVCITVHAAQKTERHSSRFDKSTSLVGVLPFGIIAIITKMKLDGRNTTVTQLVVQLIWTSYQQVLGILIASVLFLAQGKAAVSASMLQQLWTKSNRLLTPELFRRLGFHGRVYGSLHHWAVRLSYRTWIYANILPLRLLALLRYPFAVGDAFLTSLFFVCFVPAIWGLVIVGMMLKEYGNCIRVY
ncbi:uncharacterized protein MAM_05950 [Metarhizium album ARSEF 1941]|uniref:Uncharacterized protein n=1 Tax=Metarhizium album (strain ARSEF 1941) TaxID=1081103 RepID=A0A0B2WRH8_METAS|nr:uncharacterized protein MAM_05950 [Metarhizium album ARSEF 1941]KHN96102.1 hypothetical protein MAM_05950 [Metarhizium album ARSEF 1941]